MKRFFFSLLMLLGLSGISEAQSYKIVFKLDGATDTMMYIARHYRDQLQLQDSARKAKDGSYTFQGKKKWNRGIYALVHQDGEKAVGDFAIDDSRQFTISSDAKLTPSTVKVKGSAANSKMFTYLATDADAKKQLDEIRKRKGNEATKAQAEADEKALMERMQAYVKEVREAKNTSLYFELLNLFADDDVPDSIEDKAYYFRSHYWDCLFAPENRGKWKTQDIIYTPNFFNKVNYFFYGLLYYADSDTISREIDRLVARIGNDTALMRYVFDHIEPRYYRSTRNIGWDAVWCHLAENYYLKGRCPWATEGTIYNMRLNYNRIRQSIIGVHGQELWMADTNQSTNPEDWISSHRFPQKYVILWFWDPDCHHCQEQSAELKILYDSLLTTPDRPFEIYAVGYESDVAKWKKYVKEHDFRWVNVGGPNVNIDYQEAYNIHGAPTMIILDENRDIIMNKVIPAKSLLRFLRENDKKQKK